MQWADQHLLENISESVIWSALLVSVCIHCLTFPVCKGDMHHIAKTEVIHLTYLLQGEDF